MQQNSHHTCVMCLPVCITQNTTLDLAVSLVRFEEENFTFQDKISGVSSSYFRFANALQSRSPRTAEPVMFRTEVC